MRGHKGFGKSALAGAVMFGCIAGWHGAALAGSDNSNDAWAGDIGLLALPPGSVVATEYLGYRHGNEYIPGSADNVFAKLTGSQKSIPSTADLYTSVTRFSYVTRFLGQPLVFSAAAAFAKFDNLNIGNLPAPTPNGLGPQTIGDSFADPTVFVSYGLIVDPKNERFLSLSNYFYFPAGNYDKFKQFNFSTANQYTWVPQIGYAEGLAKHGLKGFWIDVIANTSVHSDGDSPFALAPGVQFDKVSQSNTYDIKGFLRYNFMPLGHVAIGIEKSWGGDQVYSGGLLQTILGGPTSFGKEDYLKGHFQATAPLARDFQVGVDLTHDFERSGGIREDFTAEVRFVKLFAPAPPPPLK
jgi:hypothetical protein